MKNRITNIETSFIDGPQPPCLRAPWQQLQRGPSQGQAGCAHLGRTLAEGVGGPQDQKLGFEHIQAACTKSSEEGCAFLGLLLVKGIGCKPDAERALPLLVAGCEMGLDASCDALKATQSH